MHLVTQNPEGLLRCDFSPGEQGISLSLGGPAAFGGSPLWPVRGAPISSFTDLPFFGHHPGCWPMLFLPHRTFSFSRFVSHAPKCPLEVVSPRGTVPKEVETFLSIVPSHLGSRVAGGAGHWNPWGASYGSSPLGNFMGFRTGQRPPHPVLRFFRPWRSCVGPAARSLTAPVPVVCPESSQKAGEEGFVALKGFHFRC